MGKVEFHAIQCAHCGLYQVQQVKKNPQFKCAVCKKGQKFLDEHYRGPAKKCREIVQRLNRARHEGEISFKPISVDSPESAPNPSAKRKSTSSTGENHSKRLKDADSVDDISGPRANEQVQMSDEDDDLFPPETAEDTPSRALSDLSIQRPHHDNNEGPVGTLLSGAKVKFARSMDEDDDDDIFDDIPSPPRSQEAVVKNQDSPSNDQPSTSLFPQPFRQNESIDLKKIPTGYKNIHKVPVEGEVEEPDSGTSVMVSRATREETAGKHPEEVERVVHSEKRASTAKTGVKEVSAMQEGWRRRSLSKLAKFRFDADDDSDPIQADVIPKSATSLRVTPSSPSKKSLSEAGACHEKREQCQTQATAPEGPTKTAKKSEDSPRDSPSAPAPEGGRGRLLATLEKFRRAPCAKRKLK